MQPIYVTTVTPVFAGEKYLIDLINKIEHVRKQWIDAGSPMELTEAIFVNDDSRDGSYEILCDIERTKAWVKVINLSRNFGQHQATVAGILHSSGDWVVTIDEDLQHDPIFIDRLLHAAVMSEVDVVYAKPNQGVHKSLFRDWGSKIFKNITSYITGNPNISIFNSFRMMRGNVARAASSVCSHGTYFDVALCWFTDRILSCNLPLKDVRFVEHSTSGYSVRKLLSHARRLVVSSDTKIVRLGAFIGFGTMFIALFFGCKVLFEKIVNPEAIPVQGWTSLFLAISFFSGLLAVMSGILLEYISIILLHIQGKPTFFLVDRQLDSVLREYYIDLKTSE
jgi:glycosyltransferase involved in cell wall biosynthesis